jgi:hypothetical protein
VADGLAVKLNGEFAFVGSEEGGLLLRLGGQATERYSASGQEAQNDFGFCGMAHGTLSSIRLLDTKFATQEMPSAEFLRICAQNVTGTA